MKIVSIKSSPHSKKIQLFFENRNRPFSINKETFLKLKLNVGDEVDLKAVRKVDLSVSLLQKTLHWLALRPRSCREVNDYLKRKTASFSGKTLLQEETMEKVVELGLVDDEKFILWWIEQRSHFRPKGKKALFAELRQKGVERDLINQVLAQTLDENDELQLARQVLLKKVGRFAKLGSIEKKRKLYGLLARRGFNYEIIKKAIDENG